AHVIADQAAAGASGKQDAFALVVIEIDLEQVLEGGTADAAWKRLLDALLAPLRVAHFGNEGEDVVVTAEVFLLQFARLGKEVAEALKGVGEQAAIGAEVARRQPGELDRASAARPKAHLAARTVVKENLTVRRLPAGPQLGTGAALALEFGESEL